MTTLIDILLYLVIIGVPVIIGGAVIYGIHKMHIRIQRINARLIWRTVARHRHV